MKRIICHLNLTSSLSNRNSNGCYPSTNIFRVTNFQKKISLPPKTALSSIKGQGHSQEPRPCSEHGPNEPFPFPQRCWGPSPTPRRWNSDLFLPTRNVEGRSPGSKPQISSKQEGRGKLEFIWSLIAPWCWYGFMSLMYLHTYERAIWCDTWHVGT